MLWLVLDGFLVGNSNEFGLFFLSSAKQTEEKWTEIKSSSLTMDNESAWTLNGYQIRYSIYCNWIRTAFERVIHVRWISKRKLRVILEWILSAVLLFFARIFLIFLILMCYVMWMMCAADRRPCLPIGSIAMRHEIILIKTTYHLWAILDSVWAVARFP